MYLQQVLNNYISPGSASTANGLVRNRLEPIIKKWAGHHLRDIFLAGSSAKGTAILGKSDVDIFVSLYNSANVHMTLAQIFDSLETALKEAGLQVRRQNVSLGILLHGYKVDIVPGVKDSGNSYYHNLYKSKKNSRIQTNVEKQIEDVKKSSRANFIKLLKIWKNCHNLEFPSIVIELLVLEALKGYPYSITLEDGFRKVLDFISKNMTSIRLVDAYNTNNIISDDMTAYEKESVAYKATQSLAGSNYSWGTVIW